VPELVSGGVRIAYETFGDLADPPILLVHGFASDRSANWIRARWPAPLTEAGFSGVALDLRGHGGSDRPRRLDAYDVPRFHGDFVAVLDTLGLASAHLLGYSLGARLCWDFALRHPTRVRSLVLGGAPLAGSFAGFDHARARQLLSAGSADALRSATTPDDPTSHFLAMTTGLPGNDPQALMRVAEAVRRRPFMARERVPQHPMLLVAGGDDPVAAHSQALAEELPNARFLALPGRTHVTAVTSRLFQAEAAAFFRTQEDARATA